MHHPWGLCTPGQRGLGKPASESSGPDSTFGTSNAVFVFISMLFAYHTRRRAPGLLQPGREQALRSPPGLSGLCVLLHGTLTHTARRCPSGSGAASPRRWSERSRPALKVVKIESV